MCGPAEFIYVYIYIYIYITRLELQSTRYMYHVVSYLTRYLVFTL